MIKNLFSAIFHDVVALFAIFAWYIAHGTFVIESKYNIEEMNTFSYRIIVDVLHAGLQSILVLYIGLHSQEVANKCN